RRRATTSRPWPSAKRSARQIWRIQFAATWTTWRSNSNSNRGDEGRNGGRSGGVNKGSWHGAGLRRVDLCAIASPTRANVHPRWGQCNLALKSSLDTLTAAGHSARRATAQVFQYAPAASTLAQVCADVLVTICVSASTCVRP